jgi:hypothetical protein
MATARTASTASPTGFRCIAADVAGMAVRAAT